MTTLTLPAAPRPTDIGTDRHDSTPSWPHLTPRQREIWALLACGHSNAAIADHLGLTCRWIDNAVGSLYGALEIDTLDRRVNARVRATLLYLQNPGTDWP
ncbi:hypothetical protein [Deinococcus yunweiensis]|uniref:hypothetical protein n=1 Tax=Deinococcus yunweiensis TaxID=367282 RepID=UPI00398F4A12